MKTIVLTGGGTAGHVTPNIALLPKLIEEEWTISYIGSKNGIEKELISALDIPYYEISSGKLRRYLSIENIKDPFKVVKGLLDSYKLLRKLKPDVVFSKGGYVSVPVVMAAKFLNIPVIIHESDITPGLANKIAGRSASKICVNFPETLKYVGSKGVLTGTPIRQELFKGRKCDGAKLCKFEDNKPVLMIMGGSLGSVKVNNAVREALGEFTEKFNVVHICGRGNLDESLNSIKSYRQFEYVGAELPDLFAVTDIILSRAGANALAEIIALAIPNVLIPLSKEASRGDQILNAASMQKQGYSEVIQEEELNKDILIETINKVYMNREFYCNTMTANKNNNGTTNVLQEIKKYK